MSRAYCCEVCDEPDPRWNLTRRGDVVTTWACNAHLAPVANGLQRDSEVTELVVTDARKAREWAPYIAAREAGNARRRCLLCCEHGTPLTDTCKSCGTGGPRGGYVPVPDVRQAWVCPHGAAIESVTGTA